MPAFLTLALLKRVAPYLLAVLLIAGILTWSYSLGRTRQRDRNAATIAKLDAAIKISTANVKAATDAALLADAENKQRVEAAQSIITEKSNASLETALADARARAAEYARRLRDQPQADRGSGGTASVSVAPDTASPAAGAGEAAVVATDASICAEAVTKAQGWQDWWRGQVAVTR